MELTLESILQLFAENDKRFYARLEAERLIREEERAKREEEREAREKEYEAKMEKQRIENSKLFKDIDRSLAKIGDTLGRFAEYQVRPSAIQLFQDLGIPIYQDGFNLTKFGQDKKYLYEVDILLFNTDYVVAIEVKSTLRESDIDAHLARLALMQQYPLKGTKGTRIIGAIAAMNATSELVALAAKKGLYAIIPNGEAVSIANDANFKPQYWEIAE